MEHLKSTVAKIFAHDIVQTIWSALYTYLFLPSDMITDAEQRRQARLLSFLLFIIVPIATIIIVGRWLIFGNISTVCIGGFTILGFVVTYLISRTRYSQLAGFIVVILITGSCVRSLFADTPVPLTYIQF